MAEAPSRTARTGAISKEHIVRHIRRQIVEGELPPGSQLPTRSYLEQFFGTTSVTVQRAFDHLIRDEFVVVRRQRTYVSTTPPHMTRYALIFPQLQRDGLPWSRFWQALSAEASNMERDSDCQLPQYHGIYNNESGEEYARLVEEVQAHRLAGLIFLAHPGYVRGTPLLQEPSTPRVALAMEALVEVPVVQQDMADFLDRALQQLALRGRRRVAIVSTPRTWDSASVLAAAERHNLECHPYWVQSVSLDSPESALAVVHLLMQGPKRPDALVITDDNLLEQATAGIVASGAAVPQDVQVVAHTNFPWATPAHVPVIRMGFEVRQVLRVCIDSIDRQRRQQPVEPLTVIPPVMESELEHAYQPATEQAHNAELCSGVR